jgi:hypothetical protein
MLMSLAKDLDGFDPPELVARIIKREVKVGALDPSAGEDEMIRHAARIVENHYEAMAKKLAGAKPKTTDTTNSKAAPAVTTSKAASQQKAAPKLTNANASAAPAAPPKQKKPQAPNEKPKGMSSRDWALRHLPTS